MRGKGVTYDTGFINESGAITRKTFDPRIVQREMRIIREDLHCNAVRITGGDADRMETAAKYAADVGLEVWFCPFTCGLTVDELLSFIVDCAARAERLRQQKAEVVLLTGSELSIFNIGFMPGDTLAERLTLLASPDRLRQGIGGAFHSNQQLLNQGGHSGSGAVWRENQLRLASVRGSRLVAF